MNLSNTTGSAAFAGDSRSAEKVFITGASDIPFWKIVIGQNERTAVSDALDLNRFSMGPVTAELEAEIASALDVPYAVCTSSGTNALLMCCMAMGIGHGDEVIVPTRTFIATAHAPYILGAKVVLVDCRADTTTLDVDAVAEKINPRTKAIMPVHLNGRPADMDAVMTLAHTHGLRVIEDACQGLFVDHPSLGKLGAIGDCGCFSFSMVKLVATGQGGAIVTRSKDVYEKLYQLRNHGVADVVSHEYLAPGGNFKFNDLQASIGLWQVRDRNRKVAHVNAIYRRYAEGLKDLDTISLLPVDIDNGGIAVWAEAICEQRNQLMDWLASRGVQTRKFLPCCHSAPHLGDGMSFPNSERFNRIGLNLPCGPDLPIEMVDRTIALVREFKPV
jgi:perosamine synthetase